MSRWVEPRLRACSTNVRCCRWRDLIWVNVTTNPTADWIARQLTEAFSLERGPALRYSRSGWYLRRCRHTPFACHGHPGQAHRAPASPWLSLEHAKATIDGRAVGIGEVGFFWIRYFFFLMTIFASQGKHAAYAIDIKLGTWRKPCRFRLQEMAFPGQPCDVRLWPKADITLVANRSARTNRQSLD